MSDAKKPDDMVHLHLHSDYSSLDGAGRVDEYVACAKGRGNKAIALTDHGTQRGYMAQYEACKKYEIKPIYGIEFYVSKDMHRKGLTDDEKKDITKGLKAGEAKAAIKLYEEEHGIRDRWHTTVWATSNDGLRNLFRLSSSSFIDGFYYKPRIDLAALEKYKDGLMVATGCLSSPINDNWNQGNKREALAIADRMHESFGDKLWLEVQPHAIADQRKANQLMLKLRDRYGGAHKLLACQDAHYVNQEDAEHHEVLLCIGTATNLSDPDRFKFDGDEFHMRTRKEMYRAFQRHHEFIPSQMVKEALDSTLDFAEQCNVKLDIDYHAAKLPDPGCPKKYGGDHFGFLKDLCLEGWTWRQIPERARTYARVHGITPQEAAQIYRQRLLYELKVIAKQHFVRYFLLIRDLYNFARKEDIMTGPGRGSVAGSLIAFLLGITAVDPIEHGLIFERFINPDRIDMPDVDMDYEDSRRHEIITYIRNKYGADKVCQIATIGKLSGKQCLKDVARVLEVPFAEVNQVTASIIERSSGDERASATIADSFQEFEVCRAFDQKYPKVLHHAKRLEGLSKTLGIHAAGVVASPVPLTDVIPLEVRKTGKDAVIVSAVDMYGVAANGLVKMDVLGLRTLTVLKDAAKLIEARHGRKIDYEDPDTVDLNDPKVLQGFTDHDYGGVFQYDTPGADKVCSGVTFTHFEDVAAMTALNRPGTSRSGLATEYVKRKKDPRLAKKDHYHPLVTKITSDTLGIMVYQEHVLRIFIDCAGFAPGSADSLRKVIAKKIGDETLGKERQRFVDGCRDHSGIDAPTANRIMDAITFFGSYGFNKCCAPDTKVKRAGANGATSPDITIEELYRAQNSKTPWGQKIRAGKVQLLQMDDDGRIRPGRLKAIHQNGTKPLLEIRTAGGRSIKVTANHRLLASDGYREASEIAEGTELVVLAPAESYVKKGNQTTRAKGKSYEGSVGTPRGAENPAWIDGRTTLLKAAKAAVFARAGGHCEECGTASTGEKHSLEFAHTRTLEECGGRYGDYHSADNARALCNSCHKRFDYQKGEHKKRWSKGRATVTDVVVSAKAAGTAMTYDVEMDTPEHNFLANEIVSHNSHATAYGMIAFWTMWCKVYYPLEFYCSLLKNEPDAIRVQQYAKQAKKRLVGFLAPSVSRSGVTFNIDDETKSIRGSLVDIKGVGQAAAQAIINTQPYGDLIDFFSRVDRRKAHKGVVLSLAKAGALDELLPNPKWFCENINEVWKLLNKKSKTAMEDLREMIDNSASAPMWDVEERQVAASQVNPLAFGRHPIDAYTDFIEKRVKLPIADMGQEDFFKENDGKRVVLAGLMVEVKLNQIGDFHTGALPTEEQRAQMFWGKRYANVNVEDASGKQNRMKFDFHIYPRERPLIELGVGTPLLVHCTVNGKYENMRAQFAVSLEGLRKKMKAKEALSVWERVFIGDHPLKGLKVDPETLKGILSNKAYRKSERGGLFYGMVTDVRPRFDKRGNEMAFFGIIGGDGYYIDVVCFGSQWNDVRSVVKSGVVLKIALDKSWDRERESVSHIFNGGLVKRYRELSEVAETKE
jgi:DNA-directed DNA polymerase III PolC